jgi:hypothetical protein
VGLQKAATQPTAFILRSYGMGMVGCFTAIDTETLQKLQADPSLIGDYLYPDDGDGEAENTVDVDKAWHGIHFMLTGRQYGGEEPLALAVLGGEDIGEDMGYGPARWLTAEQVQAVAQALEELSMEQFKARFAPAAMTAANIYPEVIWERDGSDALDYVVENYRLLLGFYQDAAERGDAAILWLC